MSSELRFSLNPSGLFGEKGTHFSHIAFAQLYTALRILRGTQGERLHVRTALLRFRFFFIAFNGHRCAT